MFLPQASMMLDIFNSLADHQQLEGLDVFQGIVNGVVKKITQGRYDHICDIAVTFLIFMYWIRLRKRKNISVMVKNFSGLNM